MSGKRRLSRGERSDNLRIAHAYVQSALRYMGTAVTVREQNRAARKVARALDDLLAWSLPR